MDFLLTQHFFFQWLYSPCGPWPLCFSFLIYTRAVGLLERVISSSQCLYLNTRQHKHRKTHIHTIKHPCPQGGIRTRSHGLREIEDCSCLRPTGYLHNIMRFIQPTNYRGIAIYWTYKLSRKWDLFNIPTDQEMRFIQCTNWPGNEIYSKYQLSKKWDLFNVPTVQEIIFIQRTFCPENVVSWTYQLSRQWDLFNQPAVQENIFI
jgi:hypothetical protein